MTGNYYCQLGLTQPGEFETIASALVYESATKRKTRRPPMIEKDYLAQSPKARQV
jgi:hypothetical protein